MLMSKIGIFAVDRVETIVTSWSISISNDWFSKSSHGPNINLNKAADDTRKVSRGRHPIVNSTADGQ